MSKLIDEQLGKNKNVQKPKAAKKENKAPDHKKRFENLLDDALMIPKETKK